jgi:hypothetical protein
MTIYLLTACSQEGVENIHRHHAAFVTFDCMNDFEAPKVGHDSGAGVCKEHGELSMMGEVQIQAKTETLASVTV